MSSYHDTAFRYPVAIHPAPVTDVNAALASLNLKIVNQLGPKRGRAEETIEGEVIPEAGDPNYYYVALRTRTPRENFPFDPGSFGFEEIMVAETYPLLGRWL